MHNYKPSPIQWYPNVHFKCLNGDRRSLSPTILGIVIEATSTSVNSAKPNFTPIGVNSALDKLQSYLPQQRRLCFRRCLSVCLLATLCRFAQIFRGWQWANEQRLNFGDDRITDPDSDLYRRTGKTCLGTGMHCPSASSWFCNLSQI